MSSWIETSHVPLPARFRAVRGPRPRVVLGVLMISLLPVFASLPAHAGQGIGRQASAGEIAAVDTDVRGDGAGLPPGSGSVAQGEALYEEKCAACHGDFGEGTGRMPALIGGEGSLATDRPRRTIGSFWPFAPSLFDYLRRAMPFGQAGSLSAAETYALTAFLLNINGIAKEDFIASRESLPGVKMPNRAGFVITPRPASPNTRCMKKCRAPARVMARAKAKGSEK